MVVANIEFAVNNVIFTEKCYSQMVYDAGFFLKHFQISVRAIALIEVKT